MTNQEHTPAYRLRFRDFLDPIHNIKKHARRCREEAQTIERTTGKYCGPDSDYFLRARERGYILVIYDASIVTGVAFAIIKGLAALVK